MRSDSFERRLEKIVSVAALVLTFGLLGPVVGAAAWLVIRFAFF